MAKIDVKYYLGDALSVSTTGASFFFKCVHGKIQDEAGNLVNDDVEDYVLKHMAKLDKSLIGEMISVLNEEIKECAKK